MKVKADMQLDARDDRMLFEQAKTLFIAERQVSVSLMQRHLIIGYHHALRIMGQLEQAGIVTELDSDNARTLTPEYRLR